MRFLLDKEYLYTQFLNVIPYSFEYIKVKNNLFEISFFIESGPKLGPIILRKDYYEINEIMDLPFYGFKNNSRININYNLDIVGMLFIGLYLTDNHFTFEEGRTYFLLVSDNYQGQREIEIYIMSLILLTRTQFHKLRNKSTYMKGLHYLTLKLSKKVLIIE